MRRNHGVIGGAFLWAAAVLPSLTVAAQEGSQVPATAIAPPHSVHAGDSNNAVAEEARNEATPPVAGPSVSAGATLPKTVKSSSKEQPQAKKPLVVPAIDRSATLASLPSPGAALPPPAVRLTPNEEASLALARQWINGKAGQVLDQDGSILFTFGETIPSVVCAPLHVCDIVLQPGEVVNDIKSGDKLRWDIAIGFSGSDAGQVTHLSIKPKSADPISTNITVMTNRRSYSIRLVSVDQTQWMPTVKFSYPEDISASMAKYQAAVRQTEAAQILPTGQNIAELDFAYRIKGDASWKPVRVYNDNVKTYIQFPPSMFTDDAPILLAMSEDDDEQIVNYRLIKDRFVVDKVLRKAALLSGVGGSQQRVTIVHD